MLPTNLPVVQKRKKNRGLFFVFKGVYFAQKLIFFPCCNFFYFFPSLFFPARKGKKWKNIFRTLNFIHIIPHIRLVFSPRRGEKFKKMFSVLLFFTFFSPNHIFFVTSPLAGSNFQNIHPWFFFCHILNKKKLVLQN